MCLGFVLFLWFVGRDGGGVDRIPRETSLDESSESVLRSEEGDSSGSSIVSISPAPGSEVTRFSRVRLQFLEPVEGVERAGFTSNGREALRVVGEGAGPYDILFPQTDSGPVELTLGALEEIQTLSGRAVELSSSWRYSVNPAGSEQLKIHALRLRAVDSYPEGAKLPTQLVSLKNVGTKRVRTTGWQLRFGVNDRTRISLPEKELASGETVGIDLDSFDGLFGESNPYPEASIGTVGLFNSNLPRREIDRVAYEFSPAGLNQAMVREGEDWGFRIAGPNQQDKGSVLNRLPESPMPNRPPGNYSRPFALELSSLGSDDEIYYTIDGTSPWDGVATRYEEPIPIERGTIVKSVTKRKGLVSPVASLTYSLRDKSSFRAEYTIAISVAKSSAADPKVGQIASPKPVGTSVEFWRDEREIGKGLGLISSLSAGLLSDRVKGRGFKLSVHQTSEKHLSALPLELGLVESGGRCEFWLIPAEGSDRSESVDWIVDRVSGFERKRESKLSFVNLLVNGKKAGLYRLIPAIPNWRERISFPSGELSISGNAEDWQDLFRELRAMRFDLSDDLESVAVRLDLTSFIDYCLFALFWGDKSWPLKGEEVVQNPKDGRWSFRFTDMGGAGSLWDRGDFDAQLTRRSSSGLIYDSLLRSARFRRMVSERGYALFKTNRSKLVEEIIGSAEIVSRITRGGSSRLARFSRAEQISQRAEALWGYLQESGLPRMEELPAEVNEGEVTERPVVEDWDFVLAESESVDFDRDSWLIPPGTEKRVWIPTSNRDAEVWNRVEFDDGDWFKVSGLFGFDRDGLSGETLQSRFFELIYNRSSGAYVRIPFTVALAALQSVDRLTLRCRVNDGFVAFLNGKEVRRHNVPPEVTWNSRASFDVRGTGWRFYEYDLTPFKKDLRAGRNVLGIHAVNSMLNGPSFFVDAELVGHRHFRGEPKAEAETWGSEKLSPGRKAARGRKRNGERWSAPFDVLPRKKQSPQFVVSELFSGAGPDAELEYVKLENRGAHPIDLDRVTFVQQLEGVPLSGVLDPGDSAFMVSAGGLARFRRRQPGANVQGILLHKLAELEELELWWDQSRVDTVDARWVIESFHSWDSENLLLRRTASGSGQSLWNIHRPFSSDNSGLEQVHLRSVRWEGGDGRLILSVVGQESLGEEGGFVVVLADGVALTREIASSAKKATTVEFTLGKEGLRWPLKVCLQNKRGDWLDSLELVLPSNAVEIERAKPLDGWKVVGHSAPPTAGEDAVVLNELSMANGVRKGAWIEIYNPGVGLVHLKNRPKLLLADYQWTVSEPIMVPSKGYSIVPIPAWVSNAISDGKPMTQIELQVGGQTVDSLGLSTHELNLSGSIGRWPNGEGGAVYFGENATLGAANFLSVPAGRANPLSLSEVVAINQSSYRGKGDWIELHNASERQILLGGMSLSVGSPVPGEWLFPAGARLLPKSYLFIRCNGDEAASLSFQSRMNLGVSLRDEGDRVFLFDREQRLIDSLAFGPQLEDRSLVRVSAEKWALSTRASVGARNKPPVGKKTGGRLLLESVSDEEDGLRAVFRNGAQDVLDISAWRVEICLGDQVVDTHTFENHSYLAPSGQLELSFEKPLPVRIQSQSKNVRIFDSVGLLISRRLLPNALESSPPSGM